MKRFFATDVNDALRQCNLMRRYRPYEYTGLKFIYNPEGTDEYKFYIKAPKNPNGRVWAI